MSDYSDIAPRGPSIRDRGPAKHFHGRTGALQKFAEAMEAAKKGAGTIFLIQGAPGSGKTALLAKCQEVAAAKKWQTARITPEAFWNPNALLDALGQDRDPVQKESGWSTAAEGEAGLPGLGSAKGSGAYESRKIHAPRTTLDVLNDEEDALLLILDEAQTVAEKILNEHHPQARIVLDKIHNGDVDRPVILAAGGLSTTSEVFHDMGVSRFEARSFVGLGRMREAYTRDIIRDWLIKDGGAKEDPAPWIDAITPETYGWPQHIMSYIRPAVWHLVAHEGEMNNEGLQGVLEEGRDGRTQFYKARAKGFFEEHRTCIARAFASVREDYTQTRTAIMAFLVHDFGQSEAEFIFKRALHKGILDDLGGHLVIPIPSMRDWFLDNYGPDRE